MIWKVNMIELTTQEIIQIHNIIVELDKGTPEYSPGVREMGTLENLVEHQLAPENDLFKNAALALYSITARHAFYNGNKRTGFGIASIILESERYHITASRVNRLNFLLKIASYEATLEDIERWLKENTCRMGETRFKIHTIKNIIMCIIIGEPFMAVIQLIALFKNKRNRV